ncbi:hypothetical protein ES703_84548 [subsurface metagenome]
MQLAQSSLVTDAQNLPSLSMLKVGGDVPRWGPKHSRAYQRLLSGLGHHLQQGHRVRILTLTSIPGTSWRDLNGWFQALRKRVDRKFGAMEYWKLRAYEGPGAGVLHILYVGPWIPQSWVSRVWKELTGAYIVYIQELKARSGKKRIARYMISNYMMHHDVFRQSWSWGWLFRGFVGYWDRVKKGTPCLLDAITVWNSMIRNSDPKKMLDMWLGEYYLQTRLKKRLGSLVDVVI